MGSSPVNRSDVQELGPTIYKSDAKTDFFRPNAVKNQVGQSLFVFDPAYVSESRPRHQPTVVGTNNGEMIDFHFFTRF
jgi:hypothetical protein